MTRASLCLRRVRRRKLAQEAAAANQSCSFATCSPAQLAVGGDKPVLLAGFCQRGSPAGQPVVGAFGARSDNREQLVAGALADQIARRPPVEDDHYSNAYPLGPGSAALDQLALGQVRPLRAQHVSRVYEHGRSRLAWHGARVVAQCRVGNAPVAIRLMPATSLTVEKAGVSLR